MSEKKYSLAEIATMGILAPVLVAFMMVIVIPISLFQAWIRTILWNWFVAPYFHLNPVKTSVMFMIGYIVTLFYPNIPQNKEEKWYTVLLGMVLMHLIALGLGYIVHQRF